MNLLSTQMAGGRALPAPTLVNGEPHHADGPCTRPSCHAMKRHALGLAQRVEELTVERDAMRAALDEWVSTVDWTPLGGERVMRALTPTEARICEALLLAGRERGPDDGHDEPPSGEFKTARYQAILRHTWGPEYDADAGTMHLVRVNASRLRHKLRAFGWDVVAVTGWGMRLVAWTGEPIPLPAERPWLHSMRVTDAERAQIASLWEGGYRIGYIEAISGRSADSIRRILRDARPAVTTPDTERWVGRNRG